MPTTRRAYYSKLHPGDRLQCNWESCIGFNVIRVVKKDSLGKYISCRQGKHYLDGHISSHKTTLLVPNFLLICK